MQKLILSTILFLLFQLHLGAQCFPDRHNTTWYDGWVSCEANTNPNIIRGESHWLMYDFGYHYKMGQMHVWNTNDINNLDWGLQNVVIDYSSDGNTWTELGIFTFDQASGKNNYEGFQGPDFDGIEAQYVLITAIDNYGGACYGLSEVRIRVDGTTIVETKEPVRPSECLTIHMYPNPFVTQSQLKITTRCEGDVYYSMRDAIGRMVLSEQKMEEATISIQFSDKNMRPGVYFLSVRQGSRIRQYRLVKIGG